MAVESETAEEINRNVSVRLDRDTAVKLEDIRESGPYDVPKSKIVRTALKEHIDKHYK